MARDRGFAERRLRLVDTLVPASVSARDRGFAERRLRPGHQH